MNKKLKITNVSNNLFDNLSDYSSEDNNLSSVSSVSYVPLVIQPFKKSNFLPKKKSPEFSKLLTKAKYFTRMANRIYENNTMLTEFDEKRKYIVISSLLKVIKDYQHIFSKSKLTRENLNIHNCTNLHSNKTDDNELLVKMAKKRLFKMFDRSSKNTPLNNLIIEYDIYFPRYFTEKESKNFEMIVNHTEGSFNGFFIGLHSWYLGKDENGNKQKIYICSSSSFGSCVMSDYILSSRDAFRDLNNGFNMIKKSMTIKKDNNNFKTFEELLNKFKRQMFKSALDDTFSNLKFFASLNEAKKYVTEMADQKVYFNIPKYIVKTIYEPLFYNVEKLTDEEDNDENLILNDDNFPML